ncbi:MAG: hypothetical protein ACYDH6_24675 [Acidimicrobiales bacterium]
MIVDLHFPRSATQLPIPTTECTRTSGHALDTLQLESAALSQLALSRARTVTVNGRRGYVQPCRGNISPTPYVVFFPDLDLVAESGAKTSTAEAILGSLGPSAWAVAVSGPSVPTGWKSVQATSPLAKGTVRILVPPDWPVRNLDQQCRPWTLDAYYLDCDSTATGWSDEPSVMVSSRPIRPGLPGIGQGVVTQLPALFVSVLRVGPRNEAPNGSTMQPVGISRGRAVVARGVGYLSEVDVWLPDAQVTMRIGLGPDGATAGAILHSIEVT